MPELFCGFDRDRSGGPIAHPLSRAPQAWGAGSVLMLLQACPQLPQGRSELRLERLQVGGDTVDLSFVRNGRYLSVDVTNRTGDVRVVVVMPGRPWPAITRVG